MDIRRSIIVGLFMLVIQSQTRAQVIRPFPEGFGIEIGGGHNDATWHFSGALLQLYSDNKLSRAQFSFTPTFRLSYAIHPLESIELVPFAEYNRFGGRSKEMFQGYKDEYWFDAIGFGILGNISVLGFTIGPGLKMNRHLKVVVKTLGTNSSGNQYWYDRDLTDLHRRSSVDLGGRVSWSLSHWTIVGESWFGVTQLQSEDRDAYVDIQQRHFRILLGYRL